MQLARVFLHFPVRKHRQDQRNALPPHSPHSLLYGRTEDSSGFFGGKAKGRGETNFCGKCLSRWKFSFTPKRLDSFVRDCSFRLLQLLILFDLVSSVLLFQL